MSLTSYRAAPPRDNRSDYLPVASGREGEGLAASYSFRRLSGSTIGAEGFHGRVRDGIGCLAPRHGHQAGKALPPEGHKLSLPLARTGAGVPGVCNVTWCEGREVSWCVAALGPGFRRGLLP